MESGALVINKIWTVKQQSIASKMIQSQNFVITLMIDFYKSVVNLSCLHYL